ncbi:hypothetical protein L249_2989 [Ophiocordyceps polyrhachis-furcata BCC 54312]|uniref:25S rRNA (uridine-N(3))-methyltransferase BMT5-like domain-containing protein n=1 Tax=Ophiocordyceps polyrhachis-furcata BCC 54312 TaxID=1330021 RepID=A0A367LRF1_9HYPO|nr:hypothetical protein L249_2989 [Ophiocordyceps polyrhachis-furcata BCC 54312]
MAKQRSLRHPSKPKPARPVRKSCSSSSPARKKNKQPNRTTVIPFKRHDRILLVGEGDLSFAASLVRHHRCLRVTATVLDKDREELVGKYPTADDHIAVLVGSRSADDRGADEDVDEDEDEDEDEDKDGGKSTDVNRQVRHNQSLLVDFFHRFLPALNADGSFVVTLFDGEPYTLWNVRDLARHAGLAVHHSFAFDSSVYPGYRHARTAGVVRRRRRRHRGGDDDDDDDDEDEHEPAPNPWRGELRPARSYVFRRKDHVQALLAAAAAASKKRRRTDDDDD